MTWIDTVILVITAVLLIHGFITGLLRSVFDIVGIIAGYVIAVNYCAAIGIPRYLALLLIFVVVVAVFSIAGRMIARAIHKTPIGFLDRILGGILGLCKAFVVCFVFLLVLSLLNRNSEVLKRSEIAPWMIRAGVSASQVLPRRWYEWIKKTTTTREVVKSSGKPHSNEIATGCAFAMAVGAVSNREI